MTDRKQINLPAAHRVPGARGFTLLELMISIAMVVVLMIGVNQVFKMSADTVGSGMAISEVMRDMRAARQVMSQDMTHVTSYSAAPFMVIYNELGAAPLNKQDFAANGTPSATPAPVETWVPNNHYHRRDILEFFVQNASLRRQSGTMNSTSFNPYQGDLTASEGWIHYGHLMLPDNTQTFANAGAFIAPGDTTKTNPNNLYANQWILGRMPMLLVPKDSSGTVLDTANVPQWFADLTAVLPNIQPLAFNSQIDTKSNTRATGGLSNPAIQWSMTDVAGIDRATYRTNVQAAFKANAGTTVPNLIYRFAGKPFLQKSAVASSLQYETALEAPIFIRGCSQFIVEYAGDYLKQDPTTGEIVTNNPVSELDWDPDYDSNGLPVRRIRWYGMARNTVGAHPKTGVIYPDVLPLAWYNAPGNNIAKKIGLTVQPDLPPATAIASWEHFNIANKSGTSSVLPTYTSAWGPDDLAGTGVTAPAGASKAPWMIRITIRIDDANGRLGDGKTIEFVYNLPHP